MSDRSSGSGSSSRNASGRRNVYDERYQARQAALVGSPPASSRSSPTPSEHGLHLLPVPGALNPGHFDAAGAPSRQSTRQSTPMHEGSQAEEGLFGSEAGDQSAAIGKRVLPALPANAVHVMKDWSERNGSVLMGSGIEPSPPFFDHGSAASDGWISYKLAAPGFDNIPFIPARALVINIPAECFTTDASRFVDWTTPTTNAVRAASIAALTGLMSTPLSKGWLSGAHEEVARLEATARAGDDQDGVHADGEVKKPKRVNRYMTQSANDPHQNAPMVCIGYEDVFDRDKTTVLAIRVWHFVFDASHSTSELARRLMDENADEAAHSGAAHQQNSLRKQTVVAAAKASRGLVGSSIESAKLETAAGVVYRHITNESVLKNLLPHYAGRSDKGPGRPPIDMDSLPAGLLNRRFLPDAELGCRHPLALEWVFNAKRPDALIAGLVHLDGTPMDVNPDQIAVDSYFDMTVPKARPNSIGADGHDDPVTGDSHAFRVPDWVGDDGCFFFQSDPNQLNVFDMPLPHTIVGAIKPGPTLQRLFRETVLKLGPDDAMCPLGSAALMNRFNNEMTGRDQWEAQAINAMADSMVGFDTFDCSADQRLDARTAKRNAAKGLASYGQKDGDDHVIEPRQVIKENAYTTSNVHSKIISPWEANRAAALAKEEQDLRVANDYEHELTDRRHSMFAGVRKKDAEFKKDFAAAMQELIALHIAKLERSFSSTFERESIPVGYRAVYDGLYKELREMPEGTANIAVAQNMQLVDSDRTVYGHLINWIGTFFEDDCYVDGRSWGLMQELFFHCFEQFDEQTLLLIFCGPKGNGKTLRTERAQKAFVDGWIVMSGPSSAKSGMQGNSDSCNGCNCVYDEMIDDLTAGDGDARIEYWKQILLKREFNYMKAVVVRGADGREMHRTYKLRTPHQETHIVCTNRGPAFTRGDQEPSDGKQALLDRSIVLFVRTEGKKTHDDAEFETNMSQPEVRKKVRTFRILTCLTGLLKMLIFRQPFLRPDMAFAQKMWDHWDERLDRKFGLPRPSPRKNVKRLGNLTTMCCLNAVAHVFLFKQTCSAFPAGQTTEKYPKGKPFEMAMLAQCIPLLQPTREIIHQAWTMGLEYNIGTSAMGFCGMSIVAEAAGRKVGDWMTRLPTKEFRSYLMTEGELTDMAGTSDSSMGGRVWSKPRCNQKLPELEKLFQDGRSVSNEEIRQRREQLRKKREMREEYKFHCSRGDLQNSILRDAQRMLDDAIGRASPDTVIDTMDVDDDVDGNPSDKLTGEARGRALYKEGNSELSEADDADGGVCHGFHCERACDFPGSSNCLLTHTDSLEHLRICPYCCTDVVDGEAGASSFDADAPVDDVAAEEAAVDGAVVATCLSSAVSCIWPDAMEACMWYKPQVLVQWAAGSAAFIEPGPGSSTVLGTRATGSLFEHKKRTNGPSGAQRVDVAWLQSTDGEWAKSWRKTADYFKNQKSHTIDMFDVHRDGLGELLWLLSTKDNARRIADEPRLMSSARAENCVVNSDYKRVGSGDCVVQMAPYTDPRPGNGGKEVGARDDSGSRVAPEHLPRDEQSGVTNSQWQRCLDTLLHAGRLAAMNPLISNRVVVSPPIRMNPESGIELNFGAVHAHTLLLAESVLACATMPGLRNAQEPFCNGQSGPEGLSAERVEPGTKRELPDSNAVHMLPYSYDIISIAIAEDAALMMYDDKGSVWMSAMKTGAVNKLATMMQALNEKQARGIACDEEIAAAQAECSVPELTFDDLPHLSLRYLGYSEHNRQTLSLKLPATRREGQQYVEAGDPSVRESHISEAHVRRSLGREVSGHAELAAYIGRRQGARSMGNVKGDLFACSTWFSHTILSLQKRGLIGGQVSEPAVMAFRDMEHCIGMRCAEHKCVQGNVRFAKLGLTKAVPGTYGSIVNVVEGEGARRQKRKTDVQTTVVGHIEFDCDSPDMYAQLLELPAGGGSPAGSSAGAGSSSDLIAMDDAPHME